METKQLPESSKYIHQTDFNQVDCPSGNAYQPQLLYRPFSGSGTLKRTVVLLLPLHSGIVTTGTPIC